MESCSIILPKDKIKRKKAATFFFFFFNFNSTFFFYYIFYDYNMIMKSLVFLLYFKIIKCWIHWDFVYVIILLQNLVWHLCFVLVIKFGFYFLVLLLGKILLFLKLCWYIDTYIIVLLNNFVWIFYILVLRICFKLWNNSTW